MIITITILAALSTAWLITRPHIIVGSESESTQGTLRTLLDQKDRAVQSLKDLDLDYGTDKLSSTEYNTLKAGVSSELGQLLNKIDKHDS